MKFFLRNISVPGRILLLFNCCFLIFSSFSIWLLTFIFIWWAIVRRWQMIIHDKKQFIWQIWKIMYRTLWFAPHYRYMFIDKFESQKNISQNAFNLFFWLILCYLSEMVYLSETLRISCSSTSMMYSTRSYVGTGGCNIHAKTLLGAT